MIDEYETAKEIWKENFEARRRKRSRAGTLVGTS
jgi:hypothetical protein